MAGTNLIEAAAKKGLRRSQIWNNAMLGHKDYDPIRFLITSTQEQLGEVIPGGKLLDETAPLKPHAVYGFTKAEMERVAAEIALMYFEPLSNKENRVNIDTGLVLFLLRSANIWGPRMDYQNVMMNIILRFILSHAEIKKAKEEGKEPPLPMTIDITSPGTQTRPFLHVKDYARAFIGLSEVDPTLVWNYARKNNLPFGTIPLFNVTGKNVVSMLELADIIREIMKPLMEEAFGFYNNCPTNIVPKRPGDVMGYGLDSTKLREVLNWTERVDFHTGLIIMAKDTLQRFLKGEVHITRDQLNSVNAWHEGDEQVLNNLDRMLIIKSVLKSERFLDNDLIFELTSELPNILRRLYNDFEEHPLRVESLLKGKKFEDLLKEC